MKTVKFSNGNINVKLEANDRIKSYYHCIEEMYLQLDFYTMEDTENCQHNEYSLGNYCIAYDLFHNGDDSIIYSFSSYAYEKLIHGKTIKLYATNNEEY